MGLCTVLHHIQFGVFSCNTVWKGATTFLHFGNADDFFSGSMRRNAAAHVNEGTRRSAPSTTPGLEHVLNDVHGIGEVGQPEAGEGRIVQSGQGFGQAPVVPGQAAKAGGPAETALDDPAAREQHEAAPGLRELDDLQGDPVRTSGFGGILAGWPWSGPKAIRAKRCRTAPACNSVPPSARSACR